MCLFVGRKNYIDLDLMEQLISREGGRLSAAHEHSDI